MSWIVAPRFVNRLRAQKGQLVTSSDYEKNTIESIIKSHQTFTWDSFMLSIRSNADVKTQANITNVLQRLKVLVLNILGGGQDSGAVNDTTFVIIVLLYNEDKVLNKHKTILKQTFGINQDEEIAELHSLVHELTSILPEPSHSFLDQSKKNKQNAKQVSKEEKLWRSKILKEIPLFKNEIHDPKISESNFEKDWTAPDLSFLNSFSNSKEDPFDKLTLNYDVKGVCEKSIKNAKRWLLKEIKKAFQSEDEMLGLSAEELTNSLLGLLKSSKTSDQLQNDLFDLIGFERFNLIESLLKHRDEILAADAAAQSSTALEMPKLSAMSSDRQNIVMKNTTSSNGNFDLNSYQTDAPKYIPSNVVIPISKVSSQKKSSSIYPNVYDLTGSIKATGSASMAKGSSAIPTNAKRRDTQTYEEVTIPAVELSVDQGKYKPVIINQLDAIGQEVFTGVTSLNRIQSLVFDTAYHTNENLLICAPTGAGKTNVAMLTIAHQIKQHISQGVILKDQFKIVYVAPMKALAAEMTSNFGKKLAGLGISVRELTGDMQLKKAEIVQTQMIVTTPEKWDVITRKGTGDVALTELVKLLIIDEVHLLHGDRGPVIEALVARTLRQVESTQSMIRIVGLSATLPNYVDVANFLRVNPYVGLFFFDSRFRPVPLEQTFIGVKPRQMAQQIAEMDNICYEKVSEEVSKGKQVMVFVHARNATGRTANTLKEKAMTKDQIELFEPEGRGVNTKFKVPHLQSKELNQLLQYGFAIHHAGLPRGDRDFVEKAFASGDIKVLVCTATLAWGVNLPAHAVIIKGTEMYNAKVGHYVHIGILDVLQIFGRAGRPQYNTSGHATIITPHEKLNHYLSLLTNQIPIESNFIANLADNLNAEVALGTIANIDEAVRWLSYSYLHVRMRINPREYGISYDEVATDPDLIQHRTQLIENAAQILDKAHMIRFNMRTHDLAITDLGRTASNYYIKHNDIELFTEHMTKVLDDVGILNMISQAHEFEQLKVRDEELHELDNLTQEYCEIPIRGGSENVHGKVNILLQTLLSRGRVNSFSLVSDLEYVNQNVMRIIRALFEISLHRNNAIMAARFLKFALMFESKQWPHETPLRSVKLVTNRGYQQTILKPEILNKIEQRGLTVEDLKEMPAKEISYMLRDPHVGDIVKQCAWEIPLLEIESKLLPITRTVLKIHLTIKANFTWNDKNRTSYAEPFWIWVEDPDSDFIYHSEYFLLSKKQVITKSEENLIMTIPLSDPLPNQYLIRAMSDRYLGSVVQHSMSFKHLIVPELHPPHTNLLELQPLPVSALQEPQYEALYKFSHFNPIQTQIFHCLYHTDNNVLLGAPTGSGKTIAAEIACFRVFKSFPEAKVVYIAPLKALVKERVADWKIKFEAKLKKKVVELTGDVTPDIHAISTSSVIVTTPEKWDGVSRSWQNRNYVQSVALIIIDEIHLLGEDRGPVLEVIVSRVNFISSYTKRNVRIVGLSTAVANAKDLANWLNITKQGMYNFRPSVRPVPLEVHISGFPGKQYCPRMAKMNKPIYTAIKQHSPEKPVMIFVSSRRQTRLTAIDLITILACETNPKMWVHTSDVEMDQIVDQIRDSNLKLTIAFGIGFHHAGLVESDRKIVETLFIGLKIQVLIATATLAWGVNFPAHLVIVKGTEFYDGKSKRYVDMPITDVLQMMGRAGRPQFDDSGVAVVMVSEMIVE
uniref:U5 small nuclear ribonucleoprotein 200 kDa helicase n=1 Tax=Cacopsylla melanoneura TaxID=428564 RepID=A0A8D8Y8W6_9HEMI